MRQNLPINVWHNIVSTKLLHEFRQCIAAVLYWVGVPICHLSQDPVTELYVNTYRSPYLVLGFKCH